jgi:hypothetical protein
MTQAVMFSRTSTGNLRALSSKGSRITRPLGTHTDARATPADRQPYRVTSGSREPKGRLPSGTAALVGSERREARSDRRLVW